MFLEQFLLKSLLKTVNSNIDLNSLVQQVIQELDPGMMVIFKFFSDPEIDDNTNPNADDPFETQNTRMGGGGGGGSGSQDAILMDNIFQT